MASWIMPATGEHNRDSGDSGAARGCSSLCERPNSAICQLQVIGGDAAAARTDLNSARVSASSF